MRNNPVVLIILFSVLGMSGFSQDTTKMEKYSKQFNKDIRYVINNPDLKELYPDLEFVVEKHSSLKEHYFGEGDMFDVQFDLYCIEEESSKLFYRESFDSIFRSKQPLLPEDSVFRAKFNIGFLLIKILDQNIFYNRKDSTIIKNRICDFERIDLDSIVVTKCASNGYVIPISSKLLDQYYFDIDLFGDTYKVYYKMKSDMCIERFEVMKNQKSYYRGRFYLPNRNGSITMTIKSKDNVFKVDVSD
jgi:hypothetical protein